MTKFCLFNSEEAADMTEIVPISYFQNQELEVPSYQRPYSWSGKSAITLFNDIRAAQEKNINEYRLGSVIICKEGGKYSIVDGQQRLTTLAIMLYCLDESCKFCLLEENYNNLSVETIQSNCATLLMVIGNLSKEKKSKFKNYVLNNCEVVKIVTDSEQKAFQFFDSQNTRGVALEPHDLLKAYHLRNPENDITKAELIELVNVWEQLGNEPKEKGEPTKRELFANYLYPIIMWSERKSGLNYSEKKIGRFKGIPSNQSEFNYAIYHKASNYFTEGFNQEVKLTSLSSFLSRIVRLLKWKKEFSGGELNQFQLTQPIIAGHRFFLFTQSYYNLLLKVKEKIKAVHTNPLEVPDQGAGNLYIKQLYECTLLFFADRFGLKAVDEDVMKCFYTWCYTLRLKMYAVSPATIDKYARGDHKEKTEIDIPLFEAISKMTAPEQLKEVINNLSVPPFSENYHPHKRNEDEKKYTSIYEKLKAWK